LISIVELDACEDYPNPKSLIIPSQQIMKPKAEIAAPQK
jgi:hypothetical protein